MPIYVRKIYGVQANLSQVGIGIDHISSYPGATGYKPTHIFAHLWSTRNSVVNGISRFIAIYMNKTLNLVAHYAIFTYEHEHTQENWLLSTEFCSLDQCNYVSKCVASELIFDFRTVILSLMWSVKLALLLMVIPRSRTWDLVSMGVPLFELYFGMGSSEFFAL